MECDIFSHDDIYHGDVSMIFLFFYFLLLTIGSFVVALIDKDTHKKVKRSDVSHHLHGFSILAFMLFSLFASFILQEVSLQENVTVFISQEHINCIDNGGETNCDGKLINLVKSFFFTALLLILSAYGALQTLKLSKDERW